MNLFWLWILLSVAALAQTGSPPIPKGPSTVPQANPVTDPPAEAEPPPVPPHPITGGMRDGIEKQRRSVRRQAELLGNWMLPFEGSRYVETPCEPIADAEVAPIIDGAAQSEKIEPKLLRAVIDQESGFHPCAMSPRGAKGLMQLMPDTASQFSVRDAFDPRENVAAGAKLLKQLLDRYKGDLSQALAAYNAGPARVDQSGGVPDIPETRDYVESILGKLRAKEPEPIKEPAPIKEPVPPKPIKN